MKFFKKNDKVLDLTDYYNKRKSEMSIGDESTVDLTPAETSTSSETPAEKSNSGGLFGFFSGSNSQTPEAPAETIPASVSISNEKRQKLAKRLREMTEKLEDSSNKIYKLQQRVEVLEKKLDMSR